MNKTEAGNGRVVWGIRKGGRVFSSIPDGSERKFLQSQTAGLLAGEKARRNWGSNKLSVPHCPVVPEPLMASRSRSSPDLASIC